jgi:RNase P/RNase MRP subunit p30
MRLLLEAAAEAAGIFRLYPVVNLRAKPASKLRNAAQQLESKGFRRALGAL